MSPRLGPKLNKEEKKLAKAFASGKFKRKKETRDLGQIAQATKQSRINLRLQQEVLDFFQLEADRMGIPYQTLINGVLHQFSKGELLSRKEAQILDELKHLSSKLDKFKKEA